MCIICRGGACLESLYICLIVGPLLCIMIIIEMLSPCLRLCSRLRTRGRETACYLWHVYGYCLAVCAHVHHNLRALLLYYLILLPHWILYTRHLHFYDLPGPVHYINKHEIHATFGLGTNVYIHLRVDIWIFLLKLRIFFYYARWSAIRNTNY